MTPTSRSLAHCRQLGLVAQVVEKWNAFARRRVDLLGIIDLLAVGNGRILGIQCTTGSNASARMKKALAEPRLRSWLECGGLFEIWSWGLRGRRGERKTWQLTRRPITLADFDQQLERDVSIFASIT